MAPSSSPVAGISHLERAHTALESGDVVLARELLSDTKATEADSIGAFALGAQLSGDSLRIEPTPAAIAQVLRASLSPPKQAFGFAAVGVALLIALAGLAALYR